MFHIGFWFVLMPLAVVMGIIILVAKLFSGAFSRNEPEERVDETRMIQEMYNSMNNLEQRMDVLETLLIEQDRREGEKSNERT
ncbi:hypothetical protein [Desulfobaculum bizertense]|uniref:Phage shock protein B n=1 Tax=Desulfobaculum bizertense DSM 18034 TaxID=1121442 RepID=A0A1T4VFR8_9BACT|nr:hypothetical protein [Desulfobaculum bizertense]UIJ37739.1 hypothetical protein LWC08_13745 [Desulfobaculum bizertense]SKA63756.1 phage shock protein B [Desulfobaculum bizertense DSM 18034]